MICEREEEIAAFVAQEYWTIEGEGAHSGQAFPLKLLEYRGEKVEQFSFTSERAAREAESALRAAAGATASAPGTLRVLAIDRKQRRGPVARMLQIGVLVNVLRRRQPVAGCGGPKVLPEGHVRN